MLSLNDFRMVFPEAFQGDFAFYPILILLATLMVQFAVGLLFGAQIYIRGRKTFDTGSKSSDVMTVLIVIQVFCLISTVFSAFLEKNPYMSSTLGGWQMGFGIAIGLVLLSLFVGPILFWAMDWCLFKVGQILTRVYSFSHGRNFEPGCPVVQTIQKHSAVPGPRARDVRPEEHGSYANYLVDKFRRVVAADSDRVTIMTRRQKLLQVKANDPLIRKAHLLERIVYRDKFPPKV